MSRGFLDEDMPLEPDEDRTDDARTVEITGSIVSRSGKALQFDSGDRRPKWVPLSLIKGSTQAKPGIVTLRLPEWWAKREGLI